MSFKCYPTISTGTELLGTSFSSQPEDVANVIQMLRAKAESVGNLKSTPEQEVTSREEGGFEIADAFSFRAQHLDDVRHVFRLRRERSAKQLCPSRDVG